MFSTPNVEPWRPSPTLQLIRQQMGTAVTLFLAAAAADAAKAVETEERRYKEHHDNDEPLLDRLVAAALAAISWNTLYRDAAIQLKAIGQQAATEAVNALELPKEFSTVAQDISSDYASQRAAEMIGMALSDSGTLEPNPEAEWVIKQTTADDIRDVIEQALLSDTPVPDAVRSAPTFGAARASMITETEVAAAQIRNTIDIWRQSGIVSSVDVVLSPLHTVRDECDLVAEGGPYSIAQVPFLPLHPICRCGYRVATIYKS